MADVPQSTLPRAPIFRCAECGSIWRTELQRDLCCTAGVRAPHHGNPPPPGGHAR